jgi:hypothetical protein
VNGETDQGQSAIAPTFQDWYSRYRAWDQRAGDQYWSQFGADANRRRQAYERQAMTWAMQAQQMEAQGINPDYRAASSDTARSSRGDVSR